MSAKKVGESKTEINQLMLPQHANMGGTVYGGTILSLADSVAYVCAARHAGPNCVTVSVDRVNFHEPIRIGELVTCLASVNYAGRTSMEIGIKIIADDLKGRRRHTNSCYFTMVCLDEKGGPKEVPALLPETEEEKRRFEDGKRRREHAKNLKGMRQSTGRRV
jgi:acyl-CoA hydrolase